MNRSPDDTETWEGEEPSEYEQDLNAAEAAGQPWFSYVDWMRERTLLQLRVVPTLVADEPDQDLEF